MIVCGRRQSQPDYNDIQKVFNYTVSLTLDQGIQCCAYRNHDYKLCCPIGFLIIDDYYNRSLEQVTLKTAIGVGHELADIIKAKIKDNEILEMLCKLQDINDTCGMNFMADFKREAKVLAKGYNLDIKSLRC